MRYTFKKRRNVRQTRKRGGVVPNNRQAEQIRQYKQMKRLLAQGTASRNLKHITFKNNTKPGNTSSPYKYGKVRNNFSNFGLTPEMAQHMRNKKSKYNAQIAEVYANIQSKANNAIGMERVLYSNKKYKNIPRVVKNEIQEKIWKNFGNTY